jgi:hypothetical protein
MARKSIPEELVQAIDIDDGKRHLMLKSETVEISVMPCVDSPLHADGYPAIPATERMFSGGAHPTKLKKITVRPLPQGGFWLHVNYATTRHIRYTRDDGTPKYTFKGGCFIRHKADAADSWFSRLPVADRKQIADALAHGGAE